MNEVLANEHVTLLELLDRLLNKGVMIWGDLVISVAGIDLVYLRLQLLLAAVETLGRDPR
ncbi:MAG: gas vesicle protein GvpJ [Bacillota bacterium]